MKRILATILGLLLFAAPAFSHNWAGVAERLASSAFELQDAYGRGFCTGWSIDNKRNYALTAEHCVNSGWAVNGIQVDHNPVTVVWSDVELDAAVLEIPNLDRPELKPRFDPIKVGNEVASYGFAVEVGLHDHFRAGHISSVGTKVDKLSGVWTVTDQPFIGGMSGGPLVDTKGKVVAMVQRSDRKLNGIGRSIHEIWFATRSFWK